MGLFNQFPFTNFHEMNLDWVINEISKINDEIANISKDEISEYSKNNVDYYGAKGDGFTDDTSAIKACADYCNGRNETITFSAGKKYLISGTIDIKTDINFNNSTIIPNSDNYIFNVTHDENTSGYFDFDSLTETGTNKSEYWGYSFNIVSDISMGHRYGNVNDRESFISQTLAFDKYGRYESTEWKYPIPTNASFFNKCKIDIKPIEIKNCNIEYKKADLKNNFMVINRNNVSIHNFSIYGICKPEGNGSIVINARNCELYNFYGYNPNPSNTWGYVISMAFADSAYIHDCVLLTQGDGWSPIAGNNIGNITFERMVTDRFDCHVQNWGYIQIKNCFFSKAIQMNGGICDYTIDSCYSPEYIDFYNRDDIKTPIIGTITIKNMKNVIGSFDFNQVNNNTAIWGDNFCNIIFENCSSNRFLNNIKPSTVNIDITMKNCNITTTSEYNPFTVFSEGTPYRTHILNCKSEIGFAINYNNTVIDNNDLNVINIKASNCKMINSNINRINLYNDNNIVANNNLGSLYVYQNNNNNIREIICNNFIKSGIINAGNLTSDSSTIGNITG